MYVKDAIHNHNPPIDIVWRSQDSQGSRKIITKLVSSGREVVVTSTRPSDSTPSKAYQEALASFEARLFFRLPEQRASSSSSASTASHAGSYTTPMERQQLQPVGDDHMFHQKGDPAPSRADKCRIS